MSEIDKKDVELFKKKEEEYNETLEKLKNKRDDYDKIYFKYDIKSIINNVDHLKKRSEEIKNNIEEHELEKNKY
jgi:hypothetical protein